MKEHLRKKIEVKKKDKSKKIKKAKTVTNPNYSYEKRMKVVQMRYGKYGSPGPALMEVSKISSQLHLNLQTVYTMLRTYRLDGYRIIENPKKKERTQHFSNKQLRALLSKKILEKMQTYNLTQRCKWLKDKWKVNIHRKALSRYYKENGIRFLSTKYHYQLTTTPEEKLQQQ